MQTAFGFPVVPDEQRIATVCSTPLESLAGLEEIKNK